MLYISAQYSKLENEIEELEEKLLRLRKQKRAWREKLTRAIQRGLCNVEELEREEAAEAAAIEAAARAPSPSDLTFPGVINCGFFNIDDTVD